MSRMQLSLKLKLSLLITSLVDLTVALVSFLLLRQQQQALTEQMIKRGHTIADNLAAGGKNALVGNDDLTLNVLVREAMNDRDVAYVVSMGKALTRPAGLLKLADTPLVQTYKTDQGQVIDFAVPLVFSQVPVGAL